MLTSAARETLAGVQTVIVDEVHAIAGTKRGAHLALSLERLDEMLPRRRRSGSGCRPPCAHPRRWPASCRAPRRPPSSPRRRPRPSSCRCRCRFPTWPTWKTTASGPTSRQRLVDLIEAHNSTIVFANSRRLAERLTARLNEIHAERTGREVSVDANPKVAGGAPAHLLGSGQTYGAPTVAGPRPSRLGQQGTARHRRGGAQDRPAESGGGDLEPGTGHRHGRRRPRHPGGGAAVGGQRPATHRPRRAPGRRDLAGRAVPQAPHRSDRLRGDGAAHARAARSRRCGCPPTRSTSWPSTPSPRRRWNRWTSTAGSTPSGAARRLRRCRAAHSRRRWTCCPVSTRRPSSPNCGRVWCTTATTAR